MKDSGFSLKPYSINTTGADMTLELLSHKIDQGDIEVPDFQRGQVWSLTKASKLVESFLLGLPVPQVFLYQEPNTKKLLVVDGQQRLMSMHAFFKGIYRAREFRLTGLESQWNGKTYQELNEPDKRRLRNVTLRATIFEQVDPSDNTSIFEVFERLNTGGMTLSAQEVRNAVIGGDLNNLTKDLNKLSAWRILYGKETVDERYRDIEMILRLLALEDNFKEYRKPMSSFLNSYLKSHMALSDEQKRTITEKFESTIELISSSLGSKAFRLKTTVNAALADAVFVGISKSNTTQIPELKEAYDRLLSDHSFIESVEQSTTDNDKVNARLTLAIEAFSR